MGGALLSAPREALILRVRQELLQAPHLLPGSPIGGDPAQAVPVGYGTWKGTRPWAAQQNPSSTPSPEHHTGAARGQLGSLQGMWPSPHRLPQLPPPVTKEPLWNVPCPCQLPFPAPDFLHLCHLSLPQISSLGVPPATRPQSLPASYCGGPRPPDTPHISASGAVARRGACLDCV